MTTRLLAPIVLAAAATLAGCATTSNTDRAAREGWAHFGADRPVPTGPAVSPGALSGREEEVVVEGVIAEVCTIKGCWMTLRVPGREDLLVRFKDYGFFVPRNAAGRTAIVHGVALTREFSVEALRHLAYDAGRTPAEIAAITEPKTSVTMIADAVWIQGSGLVEPYAPIGQEDCPPVDAGAH